MNKEYKEGLLSELKATKKSVEDIISLIANYEGGSDDERDEKICSELGSHRVRYGSSHLIIEIDSRMFWKEHYHPRLHQVE